MARHVSFALRRRIYLFSERYYWFMHSPWAGGVMLVIFMLLALSRPQKSAITAYCTVILPSGSMASPCQKVLNIGSMTV
mgnify:CR=1 FL=1